MNVYLVRKIANYKEDIFGAFASKKKAIQNAKELAKGDKGVHDSFDVVTLPLECLKAFEKKESKVFLLQKVAIFSVSKQSNLSVNAFEIQHDPEIQGDEYQILELMSKALKDNAIDSCVAEFAEKFEKYVTGRE